jgi:transposase
MSGPPSAPRTFERFLALPHCQLPSSSRRSLASTASSPSTCARHNGTAPLPVWSGNRERHRLSRTGNRHLNAALHRIALTQARYHPDAIVFIERRVSGKEAVRALKRRLSDVVYRAMTADLEAIASTSPAERSLAAA